MCLDPSGSVGHGMVFSSSRLEGSFVTLSIVFLRTNNLVPNLSEDLLY